MGLISFLQKKFRLVILNDETFGEKVSLRIKLLDIVIILLTIITLITSSIVVIKNPELLKPLDLKFLLTIIGSLITIFALLGYLNRSNEKLKNTKIPMYAKELKDLQRKISRLTTDTFQVDETKLLSYIKDNLEKGILRKVESIFSEKAIQSKKERLLLDELSRSEDRLNEEIINTTRRANLNLVIGILSTAIGVIAFGYIISQTPDNPELLTSYFIPRIFLVIFTQVFSYFFLRLYKKGMEDIKFYQNELTNIESKISGIQYSMCISDNETIQQIIIENMMNNERNHFTKRKNSSILTDAEKVLKGDNIEKFIELLKSMKNFNSAN